MNTCCCNSRLKLLLLSSVEAVVSEAAIMLNRSSCDLFAAGRIRKLLLFALAARASAEAPESKLEPCLPFRLLGVNDGEAAATDGEAAATNGEAAATDGEAAVTDGEAAVTDGLSLSDPLLNPESSVLVTATMLHLFRISCFIHFRPLHLRWALGITSRFGVTTKAVELLF